MKTRMRRIGFTLGVLVAMLLPLSAAPANAVPTNCWHTQYNTFVAGNCNSGTGDFRLWALCYDTAWGQGYYVAYSGWRKPGSWWNSVLPCGVGYVVESSGVAFR